MCDQRCMQSSGSLGRDASAPGPAVENRSIDRALMHRARRPRVHVVCAPPLGVRTLVVARDDIACMLRAYVQASDFNFFPRKNKEGNTSDDDDLLPPRPSRARHTARKYVVTTVVVVAHACVDRLVRPYPAWDRRDAPAARYTAWYSAGR
jgi:hypothetical protein